MIKSIYDMDLSDYAIKEGDVKVDAEELKRLFLLVGKYHSALCSMPDQSEEIQKDLIKELEFIEYAQNKYIVLGDLRRKQKYWYDILKKMDDKEFTKDATAEEIDNLRREVYGYYLEAKTGRENLQKEIDQLKESKIS